jgi:hypothetical protein
MKKLILCWGYCLSMLFANAQQPELNLYAAADIKFSKPHTIGRVGSHFMVHDAANGWPSLIYTFDSSFRLINITKEYISGKAVTFRISGNSLYVIWKSWSRDSLAVSVTKLDESGNRNWFSRNSYYFPSAGSLTPVLTSDARNNYFLFYSMVLDTTHGTYFRAVLLDTSWKELRNGFYPVKFDYNFSTMSNAVADGNGKIHFAIFDKLSNYHLSSSLAMYTLPLGMESIASSAFEFDKLKFHELSISEDTAGHRIKLLGYYYGGQEKVKKGIASLQFAYTNDKAPFVSKFYPFTAEAESLIRSHLRAIRKKEDPTDHLRLKEIFEQDGKIFAGNWLIDLPNYQLVKDADIGRESAPHSNTGGRTPTRPTENPLGNSSGDAGMQLGAITPGFSSGVKSGPGSLERDPDLYRFRTMELVQYPQNMVARKMMFFAVDSNGRYEYSLVPNIDGRLSGSLLNYAMVRNGQLFFLNDYIAVPPNDKTGAELRVQVAAYDRQGASLNRVELGAARNTALYNPAEIAPGKYVGAYRNISTGESGIAVWNFPPQDKK